MKPRRQSFWLPGSVFLFCLVTTSPLQAQIVPDATLPNPSIVTPNNNTSVITGGTQAGSNLFHSFEEFSVPTGSAAYFNNALNIQNIISRVTGSSISDIDGLIRANASANLFLINPNGIIFGPNASLNIGGSFLASTASSLNFADGNQFSATAHPTTPLLTVSVPLGLQFGATAGSIRNQSQATDSDGYLTGLQVLPDKTLALVGGNVSFDGGFLYAPGGRVELGGVASSGTVGLNIDGNNLRLSFPANVARADVSLTNGAGVYASGSGGGDIQVQGRRITLTDSSQIVAETLGSEPGGILTVTASESVEISGSSTDGLFDSGLFATVIEGATGTGGNLTIATRRLLVGDGAQVSTSSFGSGKGGNLTVQATESVTVSSTDDLKFGSRLVAIDAGNLTIETGRLLVRDGAQVLTSTFDQRKVGNLTVQNATEVELVGGTTRDGKFISSGLFTTAEAGATGDGGNLSISAEKLIVRDGAQVNSTTFASGRAGDLTVRAKEVELVGAALSPDGELLPNEIGLPFGSGLFAGTGIDSRGDGGTLSVETTRLSLRDGANLQTTTFGEGDAGNLTVQASEFVELIGTAKGSQFPSSLLALSGGIPGLGGVPEAKGRGGDLRVETGELIVQDGAQVTASSLGSGDAGNLEVGARSIRLDNQGKLTAQTNSSQGGNITLLVQDLLLLRRNSNISTTAGIAGAGGNGGNITIDTPFIVAVPAEDSNITANAFTGSGGRVQITAQGIFGTQFREVETPLLSDITASSEFGVNGVVEINTPDVDKNKSQVASRKSQVK